MGFGAAHWSGARRAAIAVGAAVVLWAQSAAAEWRTTVFVAGDGAVQMVSLDEEGQADGSFGWDVKLVAGVETLRDFAVMAELSYGQAELAESGAEAQGDIFNLFATGHYRLPVKGRIRPYVGFGLGVTAVQDDTLDATGAGFKLVGGVDTAVTETGSIYFEIDYSKSYLSDGDVDFDIVRGSLRAGYKQRF